MHPSVETVRKCLGDSLLKSPTTILWARHSHATPYTVKTGAKKNSSFNLMLCLVSAWQWTWWLPKRLPSLLSIESRGDLMTSRGWLQQPLGKKTMKIPDFKGKFRYQKSSSTVCILSFFLQLHTKNTLNLLLVMMRYMCQGRWTPYIGDELIPPLLGNPEIL